MRREDESLPGLAGRGVDQPAAVPTLADAGWARRSRASRTNMLVLIQDVHTTHRRVMLRLNRRCVGAM
jgi:hypothetical protein